MPVDSVDKFSVCPVFHNLETRLFFFIFYKSVKINRIKQRINSRS